MNYVSTVVGKLIFEDINLELDYMEIIDLSPADFKSSPKIREAYQNRQLVVYDPRVHVKAKRFNRFTKDTKLTNVPGYAKTDTSNEFKFSDIQGLKNSLEDISSKMSNLVNRISFLVESQLESNKKLNDNFDKVMGNQIKFDFGKLEYFLDKTMEHHSKVESILDNKLSDKEDKINVLLSRLDNLIINGASNKIETSANRISKDFFKDTVTFVPDLDIKDIKASIKAEEVTQESTEDIIKKLKELKR